VLEKMSKTRVALILALALVYPAVFFLFARFDLAGISPHTALIGAIAWSMFWLGLVVPVHILSGQGRKWHPVLSVVACYVIMGACFVAASWHPRIYMLQSGDKVYVRDGVALPLYYRELAMEVAMFGIAVAIALPIFLKLASTWLASRPQPDSKPTVAESPTSGESK